MVLNVKHRTSHIQTYKRPNVEAPFDFQLEEEKGEEEEKKRKKKKKKKKKKENEEKE